MKEHQEEKNNRRYEQRKVKEDLQRPNENKKSKEEPIGCSHKYLNECFLEPPSEMEMKPYLESDTWKYISWIIEHYPCPHSVLGRAREVCKELQQNFPELQIVEGQVDVEEPDIDIPTKVCHTWCMRDNIVIDPTANQFPTKITNYRPFDPSKGKPTGRCLCCGNIVYNCEEFCSEKCEKKFSEELDL